MLLYEIKNGRLVDGVINIQRIDFISSVHHIKDKGWGFFCLIHGAKVTFLYDEGEKARKNAEQERNDILTKLKRA